MRTTKKYIVMIIVLIVLIIGGIVAYTFMNKTDIAPENEVAINSFPSGETVEQQELKQSEKALELQNVLEEEIKNYDGEWAVYVEDLKTGDTTIINNKKMVSASLIKLFIMAKTYEEIENGNISKDEVSSMLQSMITVSDNEASNILVARLGGGKYSDMNDAYFQNGLKIINAYLVNNGYSDSEQQRDMKNSRPNPIPEQNYTSVLDCGVLLSKIYRKELVSEVCDDEMLSLLKKQTRTSKIPAGLPAGTICANKTGELSDVENDVAIVFSPKTDYIICVMSNDVSNSVEAKENISHISEIVYNHFNN